jgi:hypothetical protein
MAGVEGAQRRTMAYAEYSRAAAPLAHESIESSLRRLIHSRGRFIKKQPLRLSYERPGKGDALLFARGKLERPMSRLIQPPGKIRKPDRCKRFPKRRIVKST